MFQIFAARMFEQRVLTAYREKVAAERQAKLIEELEEEKSHDVQREAKKQRDAQKRKEKKQQQKQVEFSSFVPFRATGFPLLCQHAYAYATHC